MSKTQQKKMKKHAGNKCMSPYVLCVMAKKAVQPVQSTRTQFEKV